MFERRVGTVSAQTELSSVSGETTVGDSVRSGRIFAQDGTLLATVAQEGMVRVKEVQ